MLFHVPHSMLTRCFAEKDLQRLDAVFERRLPSGDLHVELHKQWHTVAEHCSVIVTGWESPAVTEEMLQETPNLKAVLHAAGSIRGFIPEAIWEKGIRVATANDALGKGVAETTLGLIIAGLKAFFPCATLTRQGHWQESVPSAGFGQVRELFDITIGVIGASRTGRHLLRLLDAFEVDVLLCDPTIDEQEARSLGAIRVGMEELLERSDVVTLHAPALAQLRHMLGGAEFRRMKSNALFINTARGMLVDEAALVTELRTGRISAILDVTDPEPPSNDHPFRLLPNVILLPHIAGALSNGCRRMGRSIVAQLLELASGRVMHGEITRERFRLMA